MFLFRAICYCAVLALLPHWAEATVSNPNPNLIISIIGPYNFFLAQRSASTDGFVVRVTNPQGQPIPGMIVEFFNNRLLCAPLQPCNLPPVETYGHFANLSSGQTRAVVTDANGIAHSGEYFGGTVPGKYEVAAMILCVGNPTNCGILGGAGTPTAKFSISQTFVSLDGYLSGNWADPSQSGQGLQLEFTDQNSTVVAIWFVFGPDGVPNWLYAQGTYDTSKNSVTLPVTITTGARFPPFFRTGDVRSTPWGSLTITFTECNRGSLSWNSAIPGYGTGTMPLQRITSIRGTQCPR